LQEIDLIRNREKSIVFDFDFKRNHRKKRHQKPKPFTVLLSYKGEIPQKVELIQSIIVMFLFNSKTELKLKPLYFNLFLFNSNSEMDKISFRKEKVKRSSSFSSQLQKNIKTRVYQAVRQAYA
jgi:hypothetical protein